MKPRPLSPLATRIAAAAALLCLAPSLHAASRFWINTSGGAFGATVNWSATDGGAGGATVPGAADVANFTLANTYITTFSAAVTNTFLDIEDGNVTFDLNANTYSLTSLVAVTVGSTSGQTGRLTVKDGILGVDTVGDGVYLGFVEGSTGFLTISTGGQLGTAALRPSIRVASNGGVPSTATLTVNDTGRIEAGILDIAGALGATGTVTITGPNASADLNSTTTIGSAGSGTLSVTSGGTLTNGSTVTLGNALAADGTATVSGAGSSWTISGATTIGNSGDGTLTISSGGLISSAATTLGNGATGFGTATVTGANSRWNLSGGHTIGPSGLGVMTISSAGQVVSSSFANLGLSAGGEGRVTVTGVGSRWTLGTQLTVGATGTGDLTISAGGEVSGGDVILGFSASGIGVATITGAGAKLTSTNNLTVANNGTGTLNVASGGVVDVVSNLFVNDPAGTPVGTVNLDGGSIFIAGAFINNGVFNFSDGLLQVKGNFQPSAALTGLNLNGADTDDLPALDLIGSGTTTNVSTITVGDNRRGQMLVRQGRVINVAANVVNIGASVGGEGTLSVESGAQILAINTLAVGGLFTTAGGAGTLNIAGGTVDTINLRIFNGGTVNLSSGTLAVDTAPVLDGQFSWTGGTLRFEASTALTSANVPKLLGLDGTINAGQTLASTAVMTIQTPVVVDGGALNPSSLINESTLEVRSGSASVTGTTTNSAGAQILTERTLTLGGTLTNASGARITLAGGTGRLLGAGSIANSGLVTGDGTIVNTFNNTAGGEVRGEFGKTLYFTGATGANAGRLNLLGGTLSFAQQFTNSATGQINGQGALYFPTTPVPSLASPTAGLMNAGNINLTGGASQIYGTVQMQAGSRLIVSGGATASFFDVFRHSGAEVRASVGSNIVFFGEVRGAGSFTGTGTTYFEGGYSPGNSPALITHQGSVVFGTFNTVFMEVGGTTRGTQYDAMNVAGKITFDGTLDVSLISGFQPQFGNVFNLFDWGTTAGTFTTVTLPPLATGLLWSQANLYTAGELQIVLDLAVASRTWDGGGVNNAWSTDANWITDVEPLNNGAASLIFAGNVRLAPSVDTPWNVAAITFDNTAGAFTITGPQGITIGAGGIVNNDTQTQTITAAITLSADETFNAAAGDLGISSVALAAHTLTLTGANDVVLATASGSGTITKNNAGRLDITAALGTGGVTLNANAGTTNIGASETLAALTIANGATVTLGTIPPSPAPEFGGGSELLGAPALPVPEPGMWSMLTVGALWCARERRASSRRPTGSRSA